MKRFLTKILSVTLAFVVVFATSSFTMDMHFCCNKLVDMAVLSKAKPCKEQESDKSSKECSLGQKDCCSNSTLTKKADDNAKKAQFDHSTNNTVFLQTFFYTYLNPFERLELEEVPFINYDPPWIERDILVLHETFLI
ncbi:MAG TPA: hypothetical protein ENH60_11180 [Pricia sp.]|uniref:Secreted protein n=2 Tax=root TaxID=1 RepID=A0A831VQA8_9FLAO|nr:hypothetical protein [Pricia sp.]HEA23685.1 hypothetical protein [Pricia antarctica]